MIRAIAKGLAVLVVLVTVIAAMLFVAIQTGWARRHDAPEPQISPLMWRRGFRLRMKASARLAVALAKAEGPPPQPSI